MEVLHRLVYVSDAITRDSASVEAILRESRIHNERDGISGLLIFDNVRFAQYVEGGVQVMVPLRERLEKDRRHENMEVLDWCAPERRRFPDWRMGYLGFDLDAFGLAGLRGKRGVAAVEAFNFIVPTLDILLAEALPGRSGDQV